MVVNASPRGRPAAASPQASQASPPPVCRRSRVCVRSWLRAAELSRAFIKYVPGLDGMRQWWARTAVLGLPAWSGAAVPAMKTTSKERTGAVESYFTDLLQIRASGGATRERSLYGPLANLLRAIGATLDPKVFCVLEPEDQGAGHPDFGLYAASQVQKGAPRQGQMPERGVVEVKPLGDDAWLTAAGSQASRYWERYRLLLVTNARDFVLVGEDADGKRANLETLRLVATEDEFLRRLDRPRAFARDVGAPLGEFLARALSHRAALAEPRDLASLLASYARDGLARIETAGATPQLDALRLALEDALGIRFSGKTGLRFFHSTLVQTLFYGIFSAWVLWARAGAAKSGPGPPFGRDYDADQFRWREAGWHLRSPVLRALFQQIADPGRIRPLALAELLDWTVAALDRVDRRAFFARFNEGEAVPYFYEPFLEAFDPDLRKQLGVWYTPSEVVRYMVARVDRTLRDDLGITDGLAAENVYVLDPCCGTGAYLAEVLRRIAANLEGRGLGKLIGAHVKRAAMERVFGFEIMPAPFAVARLQVGVTMQELDASLDDDPAGASIYLTNALTGWEPRTNKPLPLFPELEDERDRAGRVKQETPILVILGNPPYNGFASRAVESDERALSDAYRTTKRVRRPEGSGLNDPYVRFFRMAERRIAERTGQGVVCFISNYSWLNDRSFTGMRERYLEAFDTIRIDCLNGDSRATGKVAPDGSPDPSIFSTAGAPVGIQVGTAIATLVRKAEHRPTEEIGIRHLWGQAKPEELIATAEAEPDALYEAIRPDVRLGLPFVRTAVSGEWFNWPRLLDLFRKCFPGVKTSRDPFLVDVDLDRLRARVGDYFDASLTDEEIARRYPRVMRSTARFNARGARAALLARGGPDDAGFMRCAYRPFDNRWLYWEKDTKLLDEKRPGYRPHVFDGNLWLVFQNKARPDLSPPLAISCIGDLNQMNSGVYCVPAFLAAGRLEAADDQQWRHPNLSGAAHSYLERLDGEVLDLVHHAIAVLHDPDYDTLNADVLRAEGPRIPLPGWGDDDNAGAAAALARSAARGRDLARLLDSDKPVPGVTAGKLRPEIAAIAVPDTTDRHNMTGDDFAVTAGWGHFGQKEAVMAGRGRITERPLTREEQSAMDGTLFSGGTAVDVYLNDCVFWRNVPAAVWSYKLGGYQVLKKWLSYREHVVLNRALTPQEVEHFTHIARRIAAILVTVRS